MTIVEKQGLAALTYESLAAESGLSNELSWFFWIVVFLSVWVIYTTSA